MHGKVSATSAFPVIARELERRLRAGDLDAGGVDLCAETNNTLARMVLSEYDGGATRVVVERAGIDLGYPIQNEEQRPGFHRQITTHRGGKYRITGYGYRAA